MPCPDALSGLHVLFLKVPPVMAPAPPNTPGACSEDMPPASFRPQCYIKPRPGSTQPLVR